MTIIQTAAFLAAFALALTRWFKTLQPIWDRLPAPLPVVAPALVLALPIVAEKLTSAASGVDLVDALLVAGALILPGLRPAPNPVQARAEQAIKSIAQADADMDEIPPPPPPERLA